MVYAREEDIAELRAILAQATPTKLRGPRLTGYLRTAAIAVLIASNLVSVVGWYHTEEKRTAAWHSAWEGWHAAWNAMLELRPVVNPEREDLAKKRDTLSL